jgi:diguanylate cyclase (GGDEF)-like protein
MGTWLCPTEFDRARLVDMERRLQGARALLFGALAVGFLCSVPWLGWWPVALVGVQVAVYAALKPVIAGSERPEYPVAFAVVLAQILIGVSVALTGGAQSPTLIVFLPGIVGLPARFGTLRVVAAGLVLTEALIFAATAGLDPAGFSAHPAPVLVTAAASFGLLAFAYALMQAESQKRSESVIDDLTGLRNRRGLEARFAELGAEARRTGRPVALILCDLDRFKAINDVHGHQRGDRVLVETAEVLRSALRSSEPVFRVGGEEFLVLLAPCDLDRAVPVAERLRGAIELAQPAGLPVTASIGLTVASGAHVDFDPMFSAADRALYEAKDGGRNQVAVAAETELRSHAPAAV